MLHVAEHYGSAIALVRRAPRGGRGPAQRSHEWSRLLTGRDASGVYGIQMFSIRREQGRLAELAPVIRILAGEADASGPWRPGLVALLAELGMEAEARRELARLVADGLDAVPRVALARVAHLPGRRLRRRSATRRWPRSCTRSSSRSRAANVMIGHLVSCYGAADRYLGMLAATLGESERAEEHFERALELNRRMGAATWLAHTAYEYARFLLARRPRRPRPRRGAARRGGDARRADRHAGAARPDPRARRPPRRRPRLPDGLSPREVQILGLVARGLSNREIGATLSISEHTAANHIRSILRKTGCANRTEAASYAHRHGLASV